MARNLLFSHLDRDFQPYFGVDVPDFRHASWRSDPTIDRPVKIAVGASEIIRPNARAEWSQTQGVPLKMLQSCDDASHINVSRTGSEHVRDSSK